MAEQMTDDTVHEQNPTSGTETTEAPESSVADGAVQTPTPDSPTSEADTDEATDTPAPAESLTEKLVEAVHEVMAHAGDALEATKERVAEFVASATDKAEEVAEDAPATTEAISGASDDASEDAEPAAATAEASDDEASEGDDESAESAAVAAEASDDDASESDDESAKPTEAASSAEEGGETADGAGDERGKRKRGGKKSGRKGRKLDSFQPGEELQGTVRSVQPYGAFIDVGAERDGLVHISELRDGFVDKVEDVVKEGQQVAVRVKEVDVEKGRLSLTMRSGAAVAADKEREQDKEKRLRLRDLSEGQLLDGRVNSIVEFGAFIDIGATTDGLVHISEMSEERINRVSDILSEGQAVKVRVLSIDKKRNRISLSMREQMAQEDLVYEDEPTEAPPSEMELAFARAKERNNKRNKRDKREDARQYGDEMDDVIARTLKQRPN